MNLGEKISSLRKKNNLSQEQLAELVGVARQTISKWELGETAPDIREAKKLSCIFKVSLDELVGNEIKDVITEKVSNTERLAGIIINILKVIGILFILYIVLIVIAVIAFIPSKKEIKNYRKIELSCTLKEEAHLIEIEYDESTGIIYELNGDNALLSRLDLDNEDNAHMVIDKVQSYFDDNGGSCSIDE
ncbi:MAG TPA: hypothetical protein DCY94_00690 [Firmicutes bacterium]|nr:hypothetical protein [Bacillota bacterium]